MRVAIVLLTHHLVYTVAAFKKKLQLLLHEYGCRCHQIEWNFTSRGRPERLASTRYEHIAATNLE